MLLKIVLFGLLPLSAQVDSHLKLKIETGILWTAQSANPDFPGFNGFFLRVEPKLKTSINTFIGLRIGASINEQKNENFDLAQSYRYNNPENDGFINFTNPDNGTFSIVPTFDYYFMEKKNRPHLGIGVGYYFLTNYTDVSPIGITDPSEEIFRASVHNQIGFLLRGGLEVKKLTIGLEVNYIPKAELEIPNGDIIGTVNNSYIGLSIGYIIGVDN